VRVLHVDTGRQMRGGQFQALFLIEELRRRGWECVLAAPAGSPLARRAAEAGVEVRPLSLQRLRRWGREFDIVHAHTGRAHTLAALTSANPLVVSRRVAFAVRSGPLSRWKYRRAACYIAISRHVAEKLEAAGVPQEKIRVVYDGVPLLEPSWGSELLAVDSGDPRKGKALAEEAARLAGVPVRFVSDLAREIRRAACFLYLSESEGLGSGALMAMSAGVPVVASRVGGLPEIVEDGVTGLLVENRAPEVAAAIHLLMGDAERRERMGAEARRRVEERFTVEKMADGTAAVYEELAR